jgi:hypothetical protein
MVSESITFSLDAEGMCYSKTGAGLIMRCRE